MRVSNKELVMTQNEALTLKRLLAKFKYEYDDSGLLDEDQIRAIVQTQDAVDMVIDFETEMTAECQ